MYIFFQAGPLAPFGMMGMVSRLPSIPVKNRNDMFKSIS